MERRAMLAALCRSMLRAWPKWLGAAGGLGAAPPPGATSPTQEASASPNRTGNSAGIIENHFTRRIKYGN